ncbi:GNAT family N-acetyltransferase [Bdellovibrio bacteriovorus]|uniref:GNAT family N-acetyltransferase n=1 Tax=Bdellovibrio bacteriovorus TaxID=959 RepID=A0A1Z3N667_BDEBC|nr:GNAT family N-acetyltransferase [Bdellovibrio bacteriovorus]ASD62982.1 GNAT family N-acetyltransferase [Bdellovibrio bacteriovorus]
MKVENKLNDRFTLPIPGAGEGVLLYRRGRNNALDLYSTVVPEAARGQNLGDKLVRAALDFAKQEGVKIIPTCPYVAHWFSKHPEESGMLL